MYARNASCTTAVNVMPCCAASCRASTSSPSSTRIVVRFITMRLNHTVGATSHGEEVGADSEHARLPLDAGNGLEQLLPPTVVAPARIELGEQPAGAFHGQQIGEDEPGVADLPDHLVRVVEGDGREPLRPVLRVAVLPLP